MTPEIFENITKAALTVADYQLELTRNKYSTIELRASLHRTASTYPAHQTILTEWANSFPMYSENGFFLKEKAKNARKSYVNYFSEQATSSLPKERTAEEHALGLYKLSIDAANQEFSLIYSSTKNLSNALKVARQTFETVFSTRLNQLLDTHFVRTISSPDNIVSGVAALSPTTPERVAKSANISSLEDAIGQLKI